MFGFRVFFSLYGTVRDVFRDIFFEKTVLSIVKYKW